MRKSKSDNIVSQHLDSEKAFLIRPLTENFTKETLDEKPHRHEFEEIIWIRSGSGLQYIDNDKIKLLPRTFYIIKVGQIHSFIKGKNLKGYVLRFKDNFLPSLENSFNSLYSFKHAIFTDSNSLQIKQEDIAQYEAFFDLMLKEYQAPSEKFARISVLQNLLSAFLFLLMREYRDQSAVKIDLINDRNQQIFNEFLLLIDDKFKEAHDLEYYAKALGLSKRKLTEITKSLAGHTAKNLIIQRLITEMKRLLSYSQYTVKEITFLLGYEDPAYLCRLFKNYVGKTPQQYKKMVNVNFQLA